MLLGSCCCFVLRFDPLHLQDQEGLCWGWGWSGEGPGQACLRGWLRTGVKATHPRVSPRALQLMSPGSVSCLQKGAQGQSGGPNTLSVLDLACLYLSLILFTPVAISPASSTWPSRVRPGLGPGWRWLWRRRSPRTWAPSEPLGLSSTWCLHPISVDLRPSCWVRGATLSTVSSELLAGEHQESHLVEKSVQ